MGLLLRLRQDYGDVARFRLGLQRFYLFSHPDDAHQVLSRNAENYRKAVFFEKARVVLGNGLLTMPFVDDFWRTRRRLTQPAFRTDSMRRYAEVWVAHSRSLVRRWAKRAQTGETFDAFSDLYRLMADLAAMNFTGVSPEHAEAEVLRRYLDVGLIQVKQKIEAPLDYPEWVPTPRNRRFLAARAAADRVIFRLIRERRSRLDAGHTAKPAGSASEVDEDFLGALVRAAEEDAGVAISDQQLRDEILTIYLTGFEANSTGLAWGLWMLATQPRWDRWLRGEIEQVLGGRPPSFDDLPSMPKLRMFMEETLRLYPPGWWVPRSPLRSDRIGNTDVTPGTVVVVSPFVTQRHPAFWPDPDRFDPLRFTDEAREARPRMAYFPFGDGPRSCIGGRFAFSQMQLLLASLMQHFRFHPKPGHEVGMAHMGVMRPKNGVLVRVEAAPSPRPAAQSAVQKGAP